VAELLELIDEVDTVETKNKLAACLNTVIERSRAKVILFWRFRLLVRVDHCLDCPLGLSDYLRLPATM
jgi:hypothetical protein